MPRFLGQTSYEHGSLQRVGILLSNLGTPDEPTVPALRRYLRQFLSDPRVIEVPRPVWAVILNSFILPFRPRKVAEAYREIWTDEGSPLLVIARQQRDALRTILQEKYGDLVRVSVGMRYGQPSIDAALRELLGYLRGVLREAGPEVTRRLVEIISLHADRLYSEIMQAYTTRLRWTEDYDIILSEAGRDRGFQQLSGGEQMAAALAVRLALLREVSAIDWAFFDEPTANLDAQRRDNLAEQILAVKGFSQLFVISHDDTFEQDTDHVVRVQKVDGASQVME
jgi:DNA repair exonuclease SbcCD ATPase subunit